MVCLITAVVAAALLIGVSTLGILYQAALDDTRARLTEIVSIQARLIEAVAKFDDRYSQQDHPDGAAAATLSQVTEAHAGYKGFGRTGTFVLARRNGANIEFLIRHQPETRELPDPVPWSGKLAEPMRRALRGVAGTLVGLDLRGVTVVAAYAPIAVLNYGIVAKIDLAEITVPYVRAAIFSTAGIVLILILAITLIRRASARDFELEKAGQALRRSEASLTNAQRIARLGNWDWDIVGNGLYWSDEIYRIFGLSPQQFGATYDAFLDSVHPDDREPVQSAVNAALNERTPYSIEHRIVLPTDEVRVVHEVGEVTFDEGGRPIRMIGTVLDITERARAADEIHQLNERLEKRVEERTDELRNTQAELVKQERLAMLGQLAATVGHELRNPLGAIDTSLAVVNAKVRDRDLGVEPALDRMKRSISRCDGIIREMLDYARDHDPLTVPTNLDRWMAEFLDEQEVPHGIDVCRRLNSGTAVVQIDPELFRRVAINLYSNACEAMLDPQADGIKLLTVETGRADGWAEIRIIDTGPGMSDEVLAGAFEPLFSTKGFGVGLGLPIVRKIVEQHGGTIKIASEIGKGTRVKLKLPLQSGSIILSG